MKKLTREKFEKMNIAGIAKYHGIKEADFITACFPSQAMLYASQDWYTAYERWYGNTQTKLQKAMK